MTWSSYNEPCIYHCNTHYNGRYWRTKCQEKAYICISAIRFPVVLFLAIWRARFRKAREKEKEPGLEVMSFNKSRAYNGCRTKRGKGPRCRIRGINSPIQPHSAYSSWPSWPWKWVVGKSTRARFSTAFCNRRTYGILHISSNVSSRMRSTLVLFQGI